MLGSGDVLLTRRRCSLTACGVPPRRTTIGAAAFHCRVRNGNGWGHCAIVTRAEKRLRCPALVRDSKFVTSVLPIDDSRFTISFKERQFAGIYIQEFGKCYPPSLKLRRDRQL